MFLADAAQWSAPSSGIAADGQRPAGGIRQPSDLPGQLLVVEDNADMREYLTRLLRQAAGRSACAIAGRRAVPSRLSGSGAHRRHAAGQGWTRTAPDAAGRNGFPPRARDPAHRSGGTRLDRRGTRAGCGRLSGQTVRTDRAAGAGPVNRRVAPPPRASSSTRAPGAGRESGGRAVDQPSDRHRGRRADGIAEDRQPGSVRLAVQGQSTPAPQTPRCRGRGRHDRCRCLSR